MSAFPTRIAGCPLAGQRAGFQDWRIGCSGCTGSARHRRERPHLLSGALELGQCSRWEIPNALAGRWCARIRRMLDSDKGQFSALPFAPAPMLVPSEALKSSALLLLPFRGALFLQRFSWFLLRLSPPVQTLAGARSRGRCTFIAQGHNTPIWDSCSIRSSGRSSGATPPCALPSQHATSIDHSPSGRSPGDIACHHPAARWPPWKIAFSTEKRAGLPENEYSDFGS